MSVKCINCGVHSKPLLRKQRNKVKITEMFSYSYTYYFQVAVTSLGAFWLHGCWPFCILPFISGKATGGIRAYCKYCGHFIGTYDRNTGQLTRKSASYSTTETLQQCEC